MARPAQGFSGWGRLVFLWLSPRAALCVVAAMLLSACGTKGFSIENAVDTSIMTGSTTQQSMPADTVQASDEMTIRNAVSSAIVDEIDDTGIGWANAYTGSRGSILNVRESQDSGSLCRRFTASRESFAGVHLYRGETCFGASRLWTMRAFERVD